MSEVCKTCNKVIKQPDPYKQAKVYLNQIIGDIVNEIEPNLKNLERIKTGLSTRQAKLINEVSSQVTKLRKTVDQAIKNIDA